MKEKKIIEDLAFYFDQTPLGVGLRRYDGEILFVNEAFQRFTNTLDKENVIGRNISEFIGPEALNFMNSKLKSKNSYSYTNDEVFKNNDGEEFIATVTAIKINAIDEEFVFTICQRSTEIESDIDTYLGRFSKNLRKARQEQSMTQYSLAKTIDVSERQIQRFESGKCNPTLETIIKLSIFFKISIDKFFE